jgi:Protein of unknown function (DUF3800)
MSFRIYVDESGTQSEQWLVIGMLFVPSHGPLHSALCAAKDAHNYFNTSPKHNSKYRELHLCNFRSRYDLAVARDWIDVFATQDCYFRAIVVDWSIWDGSYFGTPFEPRALQKRRAYKKWAEMLLHPELTVPSGGRQIICAKLYLDRLKIMYEYDVLDHLRERFTANYYGVSPYIEEFQHTDSWRDANQCLQLCDLLTGGLYQSLVPSSQQYKHGAATYLANVLKTFGVERMSAGFWKQYAPTTLTQHFPKYSARFWQPTGRSSRRKR